MKTHYLKLKVRTGNKSVEYVVQNIKEFHIDSECDVQLFNGVLKRGVLVCDRLYFRTETGGAWIIFYDTMVYHKDDVLDQYDVTKGQTSDLPQGWVKA